MSLLNKVANFFNLDDENWLKHANPLSVYTRYSVFPILILSIWSRVWIGYYSIIFIILSILWGYFNPIFFNKPKSTKNWASRSVLGERVYLNNKNIKIPSHHSTMIKVINTIMTLGLPFLIFGLYDLNLHSTIIGLTIVIIGKTWFLDRMVWLYLDMKDTDKKYKSWDY